MPTKKSTWTNRSRPKKKPMRATKYDFPPITMERAQAGDVKATQEIWTQAYKMAKSKASFFARRFPHVDVEDMAQEAMLVLPRAISGYNPANPTGASFVTYLAYWLDRNIRRYIAQELNKDIPMGVGTGSVMSQTETQFDKVDTELKLTHIGTLWEVLSTIGTYCDVVEPSKEYCSQEVFTDDLERAFWSLHPLHREVLYRTIVKGDETVPEFAARHNCHRSWGNQIYNAALYEIRKILEQGRIRDAPCRGWQ